jgi:cytochrome c oxidase cbb3-type subunit 3
VEKAAPVGGAEATQPAAAAPLAVRYDQHVFAGGKAPPGAAERNPYAGDARSAEEGKRLFSSMNCDGCHGGGEGWVAPSLSDGRWRYGGSDAAVYQTIFYGRPKGMPAYGGLLSPQIIWKLVSYIRSMPLPKAVPTQAW